LYNKFKGKMSEMIGTCYFEPTWHKRDSYICYKCQAAS